MKRFFFGPVLSRRLNFSLGIDILPDNKTCSFDCLYCEIGKTKRVESPKNRHPFFSEYKKEFEFQLRDILAQDLIIDNLTFAGYAGEPTLNSELGSFLNIIKRVRAEIQKNKTPTVILTNSSTIKIPEVTRILKNFDVVVAKLDAGNQSCFLKVNKPHYIVPPISEIVNELAQLKKELNNTILKIQTLLFKDNSDRSNIESLTNAYNTILPDEIQLYSLARPPAYPIRKLNNLDLESIKRNIEKNLDNQVKIKTY
ncbi:MAG: radical SAM protein [Candidatus Helarchaeota archaeon]